MMTFEIGLQILVVVLLGVTIAYAALLNRRLARLRDGREAMGAMIAELGTAMARAESAIATLRRTAFEDDEALGRRIAESRTARDEVAFLVDRAESLSARLDRQIAAGRDAARQPAPNVAVAPLVPVDADDDDLYADAEPAGSDASAARAARATATAWLRSRGPAGPVAAAASRGLR